VTRRTLDGRALDGRALDGRALDGRALDGASEASTGRHRCAAVPRGCTRKRRAAVSSSRSVSPSRGRAHRGAVRRPGRRQLGAPARALGACDAPPGRIAGPSRQNARGSPDRSRRARATGDRRGGDAPPGVPDGWRAPPRGGADARAPRRMESAPPGTHMRRDADMRRDTGHRRGERGGPAAHEAPGRVRRAPTAARTERTQRTQRPGRRAASPETQSPQKLGGS
jgi:hypothetical protein